ncbi:hypothetical protein SAMN02745229_03674, partial [Butyrivibrio fibrisolvens DSM 3071]
QRDFGIANTNSEKYDAASAAGGATSKDNQKPKQKPKNNKSGNNTSSSGTTSTGNNTSSSSTTSTGNNTTSTADPYAEYKTGDPEVDAKIDELFETYGEDLNGLTEGDITWDWDEWDKEKDKVTKRALAAIYEKSIEKVANSFDDADCDKDRAISGNILHTTTSFRASEYPYIFGPEKISDFECYLDKDGVGYNVVQALKNAKLTNYDCEPHNSYLDIRIKGADIVVNLKHADKVHEVGVYTSEDREAKYIEWCQDHNPLEIYHNDEQKYEFEIIMDKYRFEGYAISDVEKRLIAQLFEKYFGIYDEGKTPSDQDLDVQNRLLKTCIKACQSSEAGANYIYETNTEFIKDIMDRISDFGSMAYKVLDNFNISGVEGLSSEKDSYYCINFKITRTDAGILTEYEIDTENNDHLGPDAVTNPGKDNKTGEISYCISYYTGLQYIKASEAKKPDVFKHEYELLEGNTVEEKKKNLIRLYNSTKSSADMEFLDRLFKSDASYENLFVSDPNKLSSNVQYIVGNHLKALANDNYKESGYEEYFSFINAALNGTYDGGGESRYKDDSFMLFLYKSAKITADKTTEAAWGIDLKDKEAVAKMDREMQIANHSELLLFSIWDYCKKLGCFDNAKSIKISGTSDKASDLDFTANEAFNLYYDTVVVTQTGNSGMNNYGGDYTSSVVTNHDRIDLKYGLTGSPGINAICSTEITKIYEDIERAKKELALDCTIGIASAFCNPVGKGIAMVARNILKTAIENGEVEKTDVANEILGSIDDALGSDNLDDAFKYINQLRGAVGIASSICSATNDYVDRMNNLNEQLKKYKDMQNVCLFYSVMKYEVDGSEMGYYTTLTDMDTIRLIREWDESGIEALYKKEFAVNEDSLYGDDVEVSYYLNYEDDKEHLVSSVKNYEDCKDYTEDQIKRAFYTIIHGANTLSGYSSISNIPDNLLARCIETLNGIAGSEVAPIEDEITIYRNAM